MKVKYHIILLCIQALAFIFLYWLFVPRDDGYLLFEEFCFQSKLDSNFYYNNATVFGNEDVVLVSQDDEGSRRIWLIPNTDSYYPQVIISMSNDRSEFSISLIQSNLVSLYYRDGNGNGRFNSMAYNHEIDGVKYGDVDVDFNGNFDVRIDHASGKITHVFLDDGWYRRFSDGDKLFVIIDGNKLEVEAFGRKFIVK